MWTGRNVDRDPRRCPELIWSDHFVDVHGRCTQCGKKVERPYRAPTTYQISEFSRAYGYFYDPDYGTHNDRETYP